ncbi:MAG: hypothetical protein CM1200mP3_18290 [Chloroflexota bacterium]|nr:MAG: hypothetical protein CM1200mP3_18290 [Chloroflexota bacterium]
MTMMVIAPYIYTELMKRKKMVCSETARDIQSWETFFSSEIFCDWPDPWIGRKCCGYAGLLPTIDSFFAGLGYLCYLVWGRYYRWPSLPLP